MAVDELQKESYPEKQPSDEFGPGEDISITLNGEIVNSSGHRDQLQRGYGFLSICGLALSVDNAWVALGTSLSIAICMPRAVTKIWCKTDQLQTMVAHQVFFTSFSSQAFTILSSAHL
jgi:hypothetical protein